MSDDVLLDVVVKLMHIKNELDRKGNALYFSNIVSQVELGNALIKTAINIGEVAITLEALRVKKS
jgi:hypothetical protein